MIGTQTNPLNSFVVDGRTGNQTTNKDLPEWLRKLGMKGDAYAGGMLKPQIRYGFWYKDGKINFADGTSYKAKKNKDGSYSYTDASGTAQSYRPTEEQSAYTKQYKNATSNQSFLDKASNTLGFEFWKGKQMLKDFDVNNLFFGIDKVGVGLGNALTGRDDKPLVDEWGGATDADFAAYGKPTGFAEPLHDVAHTVAQYYAMQGLGNIGGGSGGSGVFSNGGTGGLSGVGGGNAGALANSGALGGGAALGSIGSGVSGGSGFAGLGGGNMSWWDNIVDLLPAVASIAGSASQADAARDASRASQAGINAATAEQRRQFDLVMQMLEPQRQIGTNAINTLNRLYGYGSPASNAGGQIGSSGVGVAPNGAITQGVTGTTPGGSGQPDMSAFTASPDYNFRRTEGNRDINNSFAARGGALSGNALRGITDFNSNLASGEFNNFVQRQLQMAGLGGAATSQGVNAAQYTGGNVSNLLQQGGNARATGIVDQSNAITGGLNDLATWFGNWNKNRNNSGSNWGGGANWFGGGG